MKTLSSLERPVHVVLERELNPKLRVEEEKEEEDEDGFRSITGQMSCSDSCNRFSQLDIFIIVTILVHNS